MSDATEALKWFEEIGKFGFGPLVALVLFGNFLGVWVWGRWHRERIAELRAELAKEEAEKLQWKEMALGLLTPLETSIRSRQRKG